MPHKKTKKQRTRSATKPASAPKTDEEVFVSGLLERGEAARPVEGELPPGATHEIVEERPGRLPKVKRRRFSAR